MCEALIVLSFLGMFVLSLKVRCRSYHHRIEEKASPLSCAIQETIGYAGGVYIALITLVSFLQLEVPRQITITDGLSAEPLALAAVILALIQPMILFLFQRILRKNRKEL